MNTLDILIILNIMIIIALYINAAVIGRALEVISDIHGVLAELISSAIVVHSIGDGEFELDDIEAGEAGAALFEDMVRE
jgi:hypothetical protein